MIPFSAAVCIIYFSLHFMLLVFLAWKESGFSNIWKQRGIYAPILVHLYDTTTDIGIIIDWGQKAKQERNGQIEYNTINMNVFFVAALSFLLLYRIVSIVILIYNCNRNNWKESCFDVVLALLDLYLFKVVYQSIKKKDEEAGSKQKFYQLMESIFESLPQVQSSVIKFFCTEQNKTNNILGHLTECIYNS
eukprot:UN05324